MLCKPPIIKSIRQSNTVNKEQYQSSFNDVEDDKSNSYYYRTPTPQPIHPIEENKVNEIYSNTLTKNQGIQKKFTSFTEA